MGKSRQENKGAFLLRLAIFSSRGGKKNDVLTPGIFVSRYSGIVLYREMVHGSMTLLSLLLKLLCAVKMIVV